MFYNIRGNPLGRDSKSVTQGLTVEMWPREVCESPEKLRYSSCRKKLKILYRVFTLPMCNILLWYQSVNRSFFTKHNNWHKLKNELNVGSDSIFNKKCNELLYFFFFNQNAIYLTSEIIAEIWFPCKVQ